MKKVIYIVLILLFTQYIKAQNNDTTRITIEAKVTDTVYVMAKKPHDDAVYTPKKEMKVKKKKKKGRFKRWFFRTNPLFRVFKRKKIRN